MLPHDVFAKTGTPKNRLLDTNGDGTGAIDLRVDGSVTPVYFKLTVPEGHIYLISSIHTYVQGSPLGAANWAGGTALTNGLDYGQFVDGVFVSNLTQKKIKVNGDYAIVGSATSAFLGTSTDAYTAALHLADTYGGYHRINAGDSYAVKVQDNLTAAGDGTFVQIGFLDVKL